MDARALPADSPTTVGEALRRQADAGPHRPFVTCGPVTRTFREMDERADALARGLVASGVTRGDRVAILVPNGIEILELYFAAARIGAVQVPLNSFLKGEFLRHQLADADPVVFIADASGMRAAREYLPSLPNLHTLIAIDEPDAALDAGGCSLVRFADLATSGDGAGVDVAADDVMSILYTSGTTGFPKGCMMSHAYYLHTGRAMAQAWDLGDDDVLISPLPLFHSAGRLMAVATALVAGVPLVVEREFSASGFMTRAADVGATFACTVGAMGNAILAAPEREGERRHRLRGFMSTPMDPGVQIAFENRFGVPVWAEAFGQTECLPVACTALSDLSDRSNGKPVPWLDVAILDDRDRAVEPGTVGEVCVRPREPGVMFSGYWRRPEETVTATRNLWYHTGDLGRISTNGSLLFSGRKKEFIRRRGENVSMLELETAILSIDGVAEAAVVGVPSAVGDHDILACVVPTGGRELEPAALFAELAESLPYYAVPRYVRVAGALPRNALGRVLRYELSSVDAAVWDFDSLELSVAREARRA